MWNHQKYPIYGLTPPEGMYGHVEPVIGIQSNHPLNDTTVYEDDVVVHYTDAGTNTVHRALSTLPCKWAGVGHRADCGRYQYGLGNPYGFGWAVKGFSHDGQSARAMPASLHIQPWKSEPDTRRGDQPEALTGTLTHIHRIRTYTRVCAFTTYMCIHTCAYTGGPHRHADGGRAHRGRNVHYLPVGQRQGGLHLRRQVQEGCFHSHKHHVCVCR